MQEADGRLIAERYRVRSALGRGGAGAVWLAHDERLDRDVAVKEIEVAPSLSERESSALRQRVLREARTAARLDEVGAVRVYDVFEEDDRAFIVMEVLHAPSLAELVADGGPLSESAAARLGLEVLETLAAAHREGVVHRDVKPSNVIVPDSGRARLTDFGIAAVRGDASLTMTGTVLGSPSYLAPEQARGLTVGPAADLWGLGATLYYAVEGRPPFERGQPVATVSAVVHEGPDAFSRLDRLWSVVGALLEKAPADRPGVPQIRDELEPIAGAGDAAAVAATVDDQNGTSVADSASVDAGGGEAHHGGRTRRRRSPAAWVVGLVLVGLLAWLVAGVGGDERPAQETALVAPGGAPGAAATPTSSAAAVPPSQPPTQPSTPTRAEPTQPSQSPETTSTGEEIDGAPAEWQRHTNDESGYTVAFPPDWEIRNQEGTLTDFVDPATGTYLRVDWTDDPAEDPVAAWEQLSDALAQSKENYREISIEPTSYQGLDAALWEFIYTEGDADLHAYDLGFTDGERGYALNFQTTEERWNESQELWRQLQEGFALDSGGWEEKSKSKSKAEDGEKAKEDE